MHAIDRGLRPEQRLVLNGGCVREKPLALGVGLLCALRRCNVATTLVPEATQF